MALLSKNIMQCAFLVLLSSFIISCGSEDDADDEKSNDNKNAALNGQWVFEKADCIDENGVLTESISSTEDQPYKVSFGNAEFNLESSFPLEDKSICTVKIKAKILEQTENLLKIKYESIQYSSECKRENSKADREQSISFDVKEKSLLMTLEKEGMFCAPELKEVQKFKK